jgi:polyisoprenoid-binding protein YceI
MSTTEVLEQIVPTGTWNVDPAHSQVDFSVKHMGISTIRGTFSDVSATLVGGESPTLRGSIRVASVSTQDETRDAHLLGPDFFDGERYPEATFEATFISPEKVVGDFTLKGVTQPIELAARFTGPSTDPWGNERLGLELEGEINRHDYGVSWNAPLPGGGLLVDDVVKLNGSFSFVKGA